MHVYVLLPQRGWRFWTLNPLIKASSSRMLLLTMSFTGDYPTHCSTFMKQDLHLLKSCQRNTSTRCVCVCVCVLFRSVSQLHEKSPVVLKAESSLHPTLLFLCILSTLPVYFIYSSCLFYLFFLFILSILHHRQQRVTVKIIIIIIIIRLKQRLSDVL